MKIIIIISTILFITTSCSKQEGNDNDNDRLIKLDAGVSTVITAPLSKAAITTESFEATVAGWETSSTPNYTQAATWTSTPTRITIGSTDALELKNNPEYNLETSIKTYVTGWYPAGIPSNDMVSIDHDRSSTITYFLKHRHRRRYLCNHSASCNPRPLRSNGYHHGYPGRSPRDDCSNQRKRPPVNHR